MEQHPPQPPKWADRFLVWFCAPDLLEEVQGDLYESFEENVGLLGIERARKRYAIDVLRFFNYSTIKGHRKWAVENLYHLTMNNNLRFLLRRLAKQKLNTMLHILGLTLGLSVCILIGLFIQHELSYDKYHEKADRIYRVNQVWEEAGNKEVYYGAPAPLAPALREEIPGIEEVGVAYPLSDRIVEIGPQKRFKQDHIMMVDASLLNILDFEVLAGDGFQALRQPNQALLSQSTAEKFFGREDPIGKTFLLNNENTITVAGIIADLPENTHLPAKVLLSYFPTASWLVQNQDNWGLSFGASVFVTLEPGVDPQSLLAPIRQLYDRNLNDDSEEPEVGYAELQALDRIHMEPEIGGGGRWVKAINPKWLWFFGGISLIVLLLACINFINLSTAQALTRAREVGIRKAVGAGRGQLIGQFLNEAFLLIAISSLLALIITLVSLPYINDISGKNISAGMLWSVSGAGFFLLFLLFTGLLTGLYPAWLIARFKPAVAIKASFSRSDSRSNFLRKGLVVTQFTISAALLIGLLIMSRQMDYFHHKNMGFDKENIITVPMPGVKKNELFKKQLTQLSQVADVSFAMAAPVSDDTWTTIMHETDLTAPDRKAVRIIWADERYDDVYGLKLLAGRLTENKDTNTISESLPEEMRSPKVMVNERLVQTMGLGSPEEALGAQFQIGMNDWKVEVVGVVADFNISSLHEAIEPLIISPLEDYENNASIKLKAGEELPETLTRIENAWETLFPGRIYDFAFLEQTIEHYYESESRLYSLFKIFAGLAMFISCLGLWGLATFAAVQRTKEIGIRKVCGADVPSLIGLLSRDFLKLVAIALILAIPLAWYGMNNWLQNFSFRIDIRWTVFALSALLVIAIAFFTVGFQSLRAALANPVRALRNE
ncbi:MAG: ABC transporter permease [Saprospiraceae bacterium]|nr:ABC transporter permease [Lewinella sp.]